MAAPTMSHQPSGSRIPEDALKSPKTSHLFLNKPLQLGNSSCVSVNEMVPPHTPSGIRAQLGHLLPRHAYFRARVVIHKIASVPFVSGEFGVRWKFKGVQASPGSKQRLLDMVKVHAATEHYRHGAKDDKGKGREDTGESFAGSDRFQEALSPGAPTEDGHVAGYRQFSGGRSASVPALSSHASSVSSHSSHAAHSPHLSADWTNSSGNSSVITMVPFTPSDSGTTSPALIPGSTTPARGMTPFLKLKEHSVVWSHTLDTVLKFDIDRETSQILPNPLKLVVMQRVIPDDPHGSPQNPRLGAVYLNLAEYVDQGSVERRYLLKESKTNATLKLTIELEYLSGETNYIPPPLAKGEILLGIAGFLENDIVKRRPRALDLYGPYQDREELEIDLLGTAKSARVPKTAKSERKIWNSSVATTDTDSDEEESVDEVTDGMAVSFDVQRLPLAYGTKTTETLIDAIFNPMRTSEKTEENPFTIYEPPSAGITPTANKSQNRGIGLGLSGVDTDRNATIGKRQGSMESYSVSSTSSSSASVRTTASSSSKSARENGSQSGSSYHGIVMPRSTPEGRVVVDMTEDPASSGGMRGWWKRNISHPGISTAKP